MKFTEITEIKQELENIMIGFFREKENSYWQLHPWEKYQAIEETLSFLFEDYKENFHHLKASEDASDDTPELEQKLFVSWSALSAYHRLNAIESLNHNKTIPFYKNN